MQILTRRFFLSASALAVALASRAGFANGAASLPEAIKMGGMPLAEALSMRRSIRLYADKPIDEENLSTLLWCAFGINRADSGGHTAPSWHGSMETDIYVADAQGVRKLTGGASGPPRARGGHPQEDERRALCGDSAGGAYLCRRPRPHVQG